MDTKHNRYLKLHYQLAWLDIFAQRPSDSRILNMEIDFELKLLVHISIPR